MHKHLVTDIYLVIVLPEGSLMQGNYDNSGCKNIIAIKN